MPSSIVVAISFHYFLSIHGLFFLMIVNTKLIRYIVALGNSCSGNRVVSFGWELLCCRCCDGSGTLQFCNRKIRKIPNANSDVMASSAPSYRFVRKSRETDDDGKILGCNNHWTTDAKNNLSVRGKTWVARVANLQFWTRLTNTSIDVRPGTFRDKHSWNTHENHVRYPFCRVTQLKITNKINKRPNTSRKKKQNFSSSQRNLDTQQVHDDSCSTSTFLLILFESTLLKYNQRYNASISKNTVHIFAVVGSSVGPVFIHDGLGLWTSHAFQ